MKLRVVGWVYPYYNFEIGEVTWAVRNAIIDEIRKRGYDFSGRSHQDYDCTPVLNDGKKYLFSARGWGDLMAEAHGYNGSMDYTRYDFPIEIREEKIPDSNLNEFDTYLYNDEYDFDEDFEDWCEGFLFESEEEKQRLKEDYRDRQRWLTPETDLNERIELNVTKEVFECAESEGKIVVPVLSELRYLDKGDTLVLICEKMTGEFRVACVERKRNLSEARLRQLINETYDFEDREKAKRAQEEIDGAKMVLHVRLERPMK